MSSWIRGKFALATLVGTGLLGLAACGGDDDKGSTAGNDRDAQFDTTPKSERPASQPRPVNLASAKSCLLRIGRDGREVGIGSTDGTFASVASGASKRAKASFVAFFSTDASGATRMSVLISEYGTATAATKAKATVDRQLEADGVEDQDAADQGLSASGRSESNEVFAYSNVVGEIAYADGLGTSGRATRCLGGPDEEGNRECESNAPLGAKRAAAVERCRRKFLAPLPPGQSNAPSSDKDSSEEQSERERLKLCEKRGIQCGTIPE